MMEGEKETTSLDDKISCLNDLVDAALVLLRCQTPEDETKVYDGVIPYLIDRLDTMIGKMTLINGQLTRISQKGLQTEIRK